MALRPVRLHVGHREHVVGGWHSLVVGESG